MSFINIESCCAQVIFVETKNIEIRKGILPTIGDSF
jgi:hypothetical protein